MLRTSHGTGGVANYAALIGVAVPLPMSLQRRPGPARAARAARLPEPMLTIGATAAPSCPFRQYHGREQVEGDVVAQVSNASRRRPA